LKTTGLVFIVAGVFVLIAAWNTGNSLLYLVCGMMLSLTLLSVVLARITLIRLSVERSFPRIAHAGQSCELVTRVRNDKWVFHSFSLDVEAGPIEGSRAGYILKVSPGEVATLAVPLTFNRRGLHDLGQIRLSTGYPFGLFEHGFVRNGGHEVLVYPALRDLKESLVERVLVRGEMISHGGRGSGSEYHGLREYLHGDDARLISWKVSAKQGKLMLREFERPERKGLTLVLDTDLAGYDALGGEEAFENAVTFCASLAYRCIREGYDVDLMVPGQSVGFGSVERHLHRVLRCLALVEASQGTYGSLLSELHGREEHGENLVSVILTPDSARFRGYLREPRVSVVQFDEIEFG
jgi:uncharacterized protein (DUF58 family)